MYILSVYIFASIYFGGCNNLVAAEVLMKLWQSSGPQDVTRPLSQSLFQRNLLADTGHQERSAETHRAGSALVKAGGRSPVFVVCSVRPTARRMSSTCSRTH
ncbi:uncharacterized protein [Penaeus vannamei]|uniref:uncharacterized protein n=1 Tax=Penaeus vannamei TaxID=6689 RepID=UPI00387FA0D5